MVNLALITPADPALDPEHNIQVYLLCKQYDVKDKRLGPDRHLEKEKKKKNCLKTMSVPWIGSKVKVFGVTLNNFGS